MSDKSDSPTREQHDEVLEHMAQTRSAGVAALCALSQTIVKIRGSTRTSSSIPRTHTFHAAFAEVEVDALERIERDAQATLQWRLPFETLQLAFPVGTLVVVAVSTTTRVHTQVVAVLRDDKGTYTLPTQHGDVPLYTVLSMNGKLV